MITVDEREERAGAAGGRATTPVGLERLRHLLVGPAGGRPDGVRDAGRFVLGALDDVAGRAGGEPYLDREFVAALLARLVRPCLGVVAGRSAAELPEVWRILLQRRHDPALAPAQFALAAANALLDHDLPPAVVAACTVLGRAPGLVERADVEVVVGVVAEHACRTGRGPLAVRADRVWDAVERLWRLRGRPAQAQQERDAMDRQASATSAALLAPG